jgi:hypothetical protein
MDILIFPPMWASANTRGVIDLSSADVGIGKHNKGDVGIGKHNKGGVGIGRAR